MPAKRSDQMAVCLLCPAGLGIEMAKSLAGQRVYSPNRFICRGSDGVDKGALVPQTDLSVGVLTVLIEGPW